MTPAEVIEQVAAAGGQISAAGGDLVLTAPRPLPADLLNRLKAHKPDILAALVHPNLAGVSPEFAARLSPEDLNDIAAGDIPLGTVQAFEQAAIAREAADLREHFEERAGILEYDARLPRPEAELEAARITATLARNRGYLWTSLRGTLAEHPDLLAQVPDRPGQVDALPLGVATVAVLKSGRMLRQGAFSGAQEPKRGRRWDWPSAPSVSGLPTVLRYAGDLRKLVAWRWRPIAALPGVGIRVPAGGVVVERGAVGVATHMGLHVGPVLSGVTVHPLVSAGAERRR